jgi:hypothetical protein
MMQSLDEVLSEVLQELTRAQRKFPTWPTDPLHALSVLGEEFGELTKEALQLVYEPYKTNQERVHEEAVQTAAMAIRFLLSLDQYEYQVCLQHPQTQGVSQSSQSQNKIQEAEVPDSQNAVQSVLERSRQTSGKLDLGSELALGRN